MGSALELQSTQPIPTNLLKLKCKAFKSHQGLSSGDGSQHEGQVTIEMLASCQMHSIYEDLKEHNFYFIVDNKASLLALTKQTISSKVVLNCKQSKALHQPRIRFTAMGQIPHWRCGQ
jgi:hypothetical protein